MILQLTFKHWPLNVRVMSQLGYRLIEEIFINFSYILHTSLILLFVFLLSVIMNSKLPVGFVLFGMGRIGHTHANSLITEPLAQLKYIVDVEVDKVREFVASNFLDTKIVPPSELETVLADSSVDAAVVCTPTDFHEDLVVRCLKAGKAVFCEKPIAKSLEAIGKKFQFSFNSVLFCFAYLWHIAYLWHYMSWYCMSHAAFLYYIEFGGINSEASSLVP